jgi:EamA-like transporter family
MARYLLDDGVDAARLSQLRSAGAFLILLIVLGLTRRDLLRVDRRELPGLAVLGVLGLAAVHATFFVAIDRLEIGPAVTIQYLAPLGLLVWLALFHGRRLPPSLWGAVALSLVGCFFVVRAYDAGSLDPAGVVAAFGAMVTFGIYMVGSERQGRRHEPVTTLFWAFAFASLFWALVTPWWSFPFEGLASTPKRSARRGDRGGRHARAVHPHGRRPAPHRRPARRRGGHARAGPGGRLRLGDPRRGARRRADRRGDGGARRGRVGAVAPPRSRGRGGT